MPPVSTLHSCLLSTPTRLPFLKSSLHHTAHFLESHRTPFWPERSPLTFWQSTSASRWYHLSYPRFLRHFPKSRLWSGEKKTLLIFPHVLFIFVNKLWSPPYTGCPGPVSSAHHVLLFPFFYHPTLTLSSFRVVHGRSLLKKCPLLFTLFISRKEWRSQLSMAHIVHSRAWTIRGSRKRWMSDGC